MKEEIINLYQDYINYIEESCGVTYWDTYAESLSMFIEFIRTGKNGLIEMSKNR